MTRAQEMQMQFVSSSDGTNIAYECTGEGPPLVLVHGTSGSHERWASVLAGLSSNFMVIAMDRRGRGCSGDADGHALEREVEDVVAVIDAAPDRVTLLGHSFGAICTLEAALTSDNIDKLILCEPPILAPDFPKELLDQLDAMLAAGDNEGVLTMFLRDVARMPDYELQALRASPAWPARVVAAPTLLRELDAVSAYSFCAERVRTLATSTLLVLGADSAPFYRESIELVDRTLPNSRVTILAGQQHAPMDTVPDLFVDEITTFMRE